MESAKKRLFWRHHLSRDGGNFKFFCSPCLGDSTQDESKSRRVQEVSEDLMRGYLAEINAQQIPCSGCGEVLVAL